jgi:Flp pilus assembly protein TadG
MRNLFCHIARASLRLGAAQEGASAVEFALIAPFLVALLVAFFQVAVFLFAQQALQNAANEAGRLFMTGQTQADTQAQFANKICPAYLPSPLFNCNSLIVIVQSYQNFSAADTSTPALYQNGQKVTNWAYNPGAPGQVTVVQLVYPWAVVGGPLGFTLSNLPGSAAEMMGVSAFRVEPY